MTRTRAALHEEIRSTLRVSFPQLHLHVTPALVEIRGTFPVRGVNGEELDRYSISIELPNDFPDGLPIVRELGGRIPWHENHHVERNGRACVLLPDDRWRCFPLGAPFSTYLDGPLHNYFLSQAVHAETGEWPLGEWGHGNHGIYQHYKQLLGTADEAVIRSFLQVLAKLDVNRGQPCPCGSGEKLKRCCMPRVIDLRRKIPRGVAAMSLARVEGKLAAKETT